MVFCTHRCNLIKLFFFLCLRHGERHGGSSDGVRLARRNNTQNERRGHKQWSISPSTSEIEHHKHTQATANLDTEALGTHLYIIIYGAIFFLGTSLRDASNVR